MLSGTEMECGNSARLNAHGGCRRERDGWRCVTKTLSQVPQPGGPQRPAEVQRKPEEKCFEE